MSPVSWNVTTAWHSSVEHLEAECDAALPSTQYGLCTTAGLREVEAPAWSKAITQSEASCMIAEMSAVEWSVQ
mgnify:CR=1 FL=1